MEYKGAQSGKQKIDCLCSNEKIGMAGKTRGRKLQTLLGCYSQQTSDFSATRNGMLATP